MLTLKKLLWEACEGLLLGAGLELPITGPYY